VGGTRKVTNSNETSGGFTLDWKKILGQTASPEEGKKPSLLNQLNLLRAFTNRIDPVNVTWRKNQVFNRSGLLARPSLKYRLGFSDVLGVERMGLTQSTDRETISEGYSGKSGINLLATHFNLSYAKNTSQTITANDHTKNISTRFPDFGFSLNRLTNLGIVKKFFTAFTCNTGYFKQLDEQGNQRTGKNSPEERPRTSPL
jgi:hypothetical protein